MVNANLLFLCFAFARPVCVLVFARLFFLFTNRMKSKCRFQSSFVGGIEHLGRCEGPQPGKIHSTNIFISSANSFPCFLCIYNNDDNNGVIVIIIMSIISVQIKPSQFGGCVGRSLYLLGVSCWTRCELCFITFWLQGCCWGLARSVTAFFHESVSCDLTRFFF